MGWREETSTTIERMKERRQKGDLTLNDVAGFLTTVVKTLSQKIDEQEARIQVLEKSLKKRSES